MRVDESVGAPPANPSKTKPFKSIRVGQLRPSSRNALMCAF